MAVDTYLLNLNNGARIPEPLLRGLNTFITNVQLPLLAMTAAIAVVLLGYETLRRIIDPNKEGFDPMIFVRLGLVFLGLGSYQYLVELLIDTPMNLVHNIVVSGVSAMAGGAEADLDKVFNSYAEYVGTDKNGTASVIELTEFLTFIHLFTGIIGRICVQMVIVISVLNQSLYYLMGMLIFPFSLIIGNKNVFPNWFFSFIASKFSVSVGVMIMGILVTMPDLEVMGSSSGIGADIINAVFHLTIQIVGILMLLSSTSLANRLVSSFSNQLGYGDVSNAFRSTFFGFSPMQGVSSLLGSNKK